jgi:hypothetical protein
MGMSNLCMMTVSGVCFPVSMERQPETSRDERTMRYFLCRRYAHRRGLAAGLVLILLAFAVMCPVMVPTMGSSNPQS